LFSIGTIRCIPCCIRVSGLRALFVNEIILRDAQQKKSSLVRKLFSLEKAHLQAEKCAVFSLAKLHFSLGTEILKKCFPSEK
jgi:hypothetical protein